MKKKPTLITERLTTTKLVEVVAADLGITLKEAHETIVVVFDAIARAAASGHDVAVTNFGTWISSRTRRRTARNPQNGDPVPVAAFQKVRFRVSPHLREAVRRRDRKVTIRKAPKGARTAAE
ncbi:HU family DNA-binding protein [Streptomyces cinnabarinus]|uniref:HU family DNA-binding protein n=1 Tax=Streptomyces cinnabarinus TaxID=67287 RepID=A0ABY7KBB8_9ACTN|nr:HU family DNA-binding protein [Streptomyces cinnabarinus]WAZ20226.1 HU family DNA-binding protein [Streptomyces cinnabarinus]